MVLPSLTTSSIPIVYVIMLIGASILFISAYIMSWWASYNNCERTSYTDNIIYGAKVAGFSVLVIGLINYFEFLRKPFYQLTGQNVKGEVITYSFYVILGTLPFILTNYYDSIKNGCVMSMAEIDEKSKELDRLYNEESKK